MEAQQSRPIGYKLVCKQNVFCYRDVRSYVKAKLSKIASICSWSTSAFEIPWVMFPLLRCLLMPSPSLLLGPLNFKSAFSLQRIFRCEIFPCEDWQFGVLAFAVLFSWEMAWDSPIVNIVLQTMKRHLFQNTLVIQWWNSKSLSVECCLEIKIAVTSNYCMTSWQTPSDIYK